jgi:hypothetical protein
MQRGPPCEEDPALPVLFTLINQLRKIALAIFLSYLLSMSMHTTAGWWFQRRVMA